MYRRQRKQLRRQYRQLRMTLNNLIIFLKYPEPGQVKTRLGKDIGYEKAADIYSIFVIHLLSNFINSKNYNITIQYSPEDKSNEISEWLNFNNIEPQIGNNLGEKLSNAFDKSFKKGYLNTVLIGTDCIEITNKDIENAFSLLSEGYDSVLGPTYDGGYYLIGFSDNNHPFLFKEIDWSSEKVFSQTIKKLNYAEMKNKILDFYNDIDEISDINSNVIKIIKRYKPDFRI